MRLSFCVLGTLVVVGCARERTGPSTNVGPTLPLAAFVVSPVGSALSSGECRAVQLEEYTSRGLRAVAVLIGEPSQLSRRLLVVTDSAGNVRRFSDVRFGADGGSVEADFITGRGLVMAGSGRRGIWRGSPSEVFASANLGKPAETARAVIERCRSA